MTEKETKKSKERYELGQAVTQTSPAIIDTTKAEDDEARIVGVYPPEMEGMAKTEVAKLNMLDKLEKGMLG